MEIKALEYADLPKVKTLQPPGWTDISVSIQYYLDAPYCFPVKIESGDTLAGIGTTIVLRDTVWLAHIIVHPDFRRQGLGEKITRALVDSVDRSQYKTIYLIATDEGAPVYLKVGFENEGTYSFLKDGNTTFDIHPSIEPATDADVPAIYEMDRLASGEDRSVVLKTFMTGGMVFRNAGTIEGFYLPAIRDGLVIAMNPVAGIELLKRRLADHPLAIFPDENTVVRHFLDAQGFEYMRKATRMRLGEKRIRHPEMYYNRLGGHLG